MPLLRRLTGQGMPKKSEFMAAVVFGEVRPGVRQVKCNPTLMERPVMTRQGGMPDPKVCNRLALYPCFLGQLPDRSDIAGFPRFDTALDQLQPRQGMSKSQDLQHRCMPQHHGAGFVYS